MDDARFKRALQDTGWIHEPADSRNGTPAAWVHPAGNTFVTEQPQTSTGFCCAYARWVALSTLCDAYATTAPTPDPPTRPG